MKNLTRTISNKNASLVMPGPDPSNKHHLFVSSTMKLKPEWIDYNGHLNMAYYIVLFDEAGDEFWDKVGLGPNYLKKTRCTTYAASCKIDYIKEIKPDAELTIYGSVRELAPKKFITWQAIYDQNDNLCSSAEILILHVDQSGQTPKVAPLPDEVYKKLEDILSQNKDFTPPTPTKRPIELNRPS